MNAHTESRPALGIVGAGKVGGALARLAHAHGYVITAVNSRQPSDAVALAEVVGAQVVASAAEVVARADLTLLTIPDDALAAMASTLTTTAPLTPKAIIHTSGAHSHDVLAPLAAYGYLIGSLHPAYPFSGPVESLAGVGFAVEASGEPLATWLRDLIDALGGRALAIPPGGKPIYHAALSIASNYTVTLYALAETLLRSLGADRAEAAAAILPLLDATVDNIHQRGIPDALTGPLVRGDAGTVAAHLAALEASDADTAQLYRALARATLPLVEARGVETDELARLLDADA
ncbi:MAG: DUF2520 domain-containing protein [Anaerolineae bacterium]|nr:DUF2520 domain-containing protein [Anaerolineae bacterium]